MIDKKYLSDLIQSKSQEILPIPPEQDALAELKSQGKLQAPIKAVIFDVYGTILVSGAGDIGCLTTTSQDELLAQTIQAVLLTSNFSQKDLAQKFHQLIVQEHQEKKQKGILYPEVDIVVIWQKFLGELGLAYSSEKCLELSLYYELLVNPVWPMPDLRQVLTWLKKRKIMLGIVSNAQVYTPLILETLLDSSLSELGFEQKLCVWSYLEGRAKPDPYLFVKVEKELKTMEISAKEIVYVGNDRLKDVWPAQKLGWQTILFVGDKRSLRWRGQDERLKGCIPDELIFSLTELENKL